MKFKLKSGLDIAASSWGKEADPLVVLMHGGGQTRHAWGKTGEVLGNSGFQVVAIDLRGHGNSDWHPEGDYSIDGYKSDLISILNQLKKPASLVGASLGGMIGFSLAGDKDFKNLVTSLVMVDIGLYPNQQGADQVIQFMQSGSEGFSSLEEASDVISGYLPHRKRPRDNRGLEKNLRLREDGRYYWHWDPKFIEGRTNRKEGEQKAANTEIAKNIKIPILLIRGALSDVVTQEEVNDFLTALPHSEFKEIEQAAHMIAGDRNDIFAASAIDFLKRITL